MTIRESFGRVYWFTGLSGAGKTTIGGLFYRYLLSLGKKVVYLDGDVLREIFGNNHGHTIEERRLLAFGYSRLCQMLAEQGLDVVCATISMFHDVRERNRQHLKRYVEIYIKVPIKVLIERDQKQLYSRALRGEIDHVMGVDVEIEEPECPDCILLNDGTSSLDELKEELVGKLSEKYGVNL